MAFQSSSLDQAGERWRLWVKTDAGTLPINTVIIFWETGVQVASDIAASVEAQGSGRLQFAIERVRSPELIITPLGQRPCLLKAVPPLSGGHVVSLCHSEVRELIFAERHTIARANA